MTLIKMHNCMITKTITTIRLTNKEGVFVVKDNLNNLNIPPFRGGNIKIGIKRIYD